MIPWESKTRTEILGILIDNGIVYTNAEYKMISDIIKVVKQEVKSASEEILQHSPRCCNCGFCKRKRKVFEDRGIK